MSRIADHHGPTGKREEWWLHRELPLPPNELELPEYAHDLHVTAMLRRTPLTVGPGTAVWQAQRYAERMRVHHLLVTHLGALIGVLCSCDLFDAQADTVVHQRMTPDPLTVRPWARADAALPIMLWRGVGCLPVVHQAGELVGVITRGDLVRLGVLPAELITRCSSCNTAHHVRAGRGGVPFCIECWALSHPHPDDELGTAG
ncbi:MAG TPA: CBS domain-containing protein [Gemmatimonadales bacterium]|nr:CBS domain-containing protein [Gemmatimonadales bacterium]